MNWDLLRWFIAAAAIGLVGLTLLTRAIIGDRAKGRRRCPKCWHDLAETERSFQTGKLKELRCPECGYLVRQPKQLGKARRPKWAIAVSVVLLIITTHLASHARNINNYGWQGAIPTTFLVLNWKWIPEEWISSDPNTGSLLSRLEDETQWPWLRDLRHNLLIHSARRTLMHSKDLNAGVRAAHITDSFFFWGDEEPEFTLPKTTPPLAERAIQTFIQDPDAPDFESLLDIFVAIADVYSNLNQRRFVYLRPDDQRAIAEAFLASNKYSFAAAWFLEHTIDLEPQAIDLLLTHTNSPYRDQYNLNAIYRFLASASQDSPSIHCLLLTSLSSPDYTRRYNSSRALLRSSIYARATPMKSTNASDARDPNAPWHQSLESLFWELTNEGPSTGIAWLAAGALESPRICGTFSKSHAEAAINWAAETERYDHELISSPMVTPDFEKKYSPETYQGIMSVYLSSLDLIDTEGCLSLAQDLEFDTKQFAHFFNEDFIEFHSKSVQSLLERIGDPRWLTNIRNTFNLTPPTGTTPPPAP